MSRIHWSRHWGVLALVGAVGSFATTGCMAEQDVEGPLGEAEAGLEIESARRTDLPPWVQGGSQSQTAQIRTDAEIAGVLRAANLAEIEYSQVACTGAESPEVKAFAEAMVAHHIEALEREGQLFHQNDIVPVNSEQGSAFIAAVHGLFEGARDAQGADLDVEFMAGQVQFHVALLNLIDMVLLPAARNEALRTELVAVRTATLNHLQQAYDIYCEVSGEDPWAQPEEPGLLRPGGAIDLGFYNRELLRSVSDIDLDLYNRELLRSGTDIDIELYNPELLRSGTDIDLDLYNRQLLRSGTDIDLDLYNRQLLTEGVQIGLFMGVPVLVRRAGGLDLDLDEEGQPPSELWSLITWLPE